MIPSIVSCCDNLPDDHSQYRWVFLCVWPALDIRSWSSMYIGRYTFRPAGGQIASHVVIGWLVDADGIAHTLPGCPLQDVLPRQFYMRWYFIRNQWLMSQQGLLWNNDCSDNKACSHDSSCLGLVTDTSLVEGTIFCQPLSKSCLRNILPPR